jgi:hypothetical protein
VAHGGWFKTASGISMRERLRRSGGARRNRNRRRWRVGQRLQLGRIGRWVVATHAYELRDKAAGVTAFAMHEQLDTVGNAAARIAARRQVDTGLQDAGGRAAKRLFSTSRTFPTPNFADQDAVWAMAQGGAQQVANGDRGHPP